MRRSRIRSILLYVAAALLLVWALSPIVWLVISSISTRIDLYAVPYKHWIPAHPTLDNYKAIFTSGGQYLSASGSIPSGSTLIAGVRNSFITSVCAAAVITVLSTLAAYAFARIRFAGRRLLFLVIMVLLPLPIWVSLIRLYFVIADLNLLDTDLGMILIFVAYGLPLYIWIMETYLRATPKEIEDAAFIDGCSRLTALWRVIVPVALPGLAAVFLTSLLTTWNAFIIPLIFSNSEASQTLPVVLSLYIGQYSVAWEAMAAAAVVTLLPPLVLALFFQRYLVRGLSFGAVQ